MTDDELRAEALGRMKVGTFVTDDVPPRHRSRVIIAKVDCCGEVLESRCELTPQESITKAWVKVKNDLAGRYVERWHAVLSTGRLPV